jgi:hypothetical protein
MLTDSLNIILEPSVKTKRSPCLVTILPSTLINESLQENIILVLVISFIKRGEREGGLQDRCRQNHLQIEVHNFLQ